MHAASVLNTVTVTLKLLAEVFVMSQQIVRSATEAQGGQMHAEN